jgi:glycosyltransferase involved in cell wall biosynthesis
MADRPADRTPDQRRVLLTVSGSIPGDLDEQVRAGNRPRADYVVMQSALGADLVDVDDALAGGGRIGRLLHRLGAREVLLAWFCFRRRRRYDTIVTDGEQVGIPFSLLCRLFGRGSASHAMVVHILSVPKKSLVIRFARLAGMIDRYIVYCSAQREFIHEHLGVPLEKISLSTFMVDTRFFDPDPVEVPRRRMICSAGLERRDYPTLIDAVDGLEVEVVIAAASPWSKQSDSTTGRTIPANVEIRRLNLFELREVYAASEFVVMPLYDVDFQAGITTILEGMAMARPIVCTRTPGQTDTVIDGETGVYVPPGDPMGLREAIVRLLDDPDETRRLGQSARKWVVEHADIEQYARSIAEFVGIPATGP